MARVASLDEVDAKLRSHIASLLRASDEAIILPSASRSSESGSVKNVVVRLGGEEEGVHADLFSPSWFSGVSLMQVSTEKAEALLGNKAKRGEALRKLAEMTPSEMADANLQCGPELDCDERERDVTGWIPGFDSPSCCVGLYSATQKRCPEGVEAGMRRASRAYYLVCKAGAGTAGQTFHARLCASLKLGRSLNAALAPDGTPGETALRRVASAAKRNRSRLLLLAAECLGFHGCDTIGDNAGPVGGGYRLAIPFIDCCYNSLARVDDALGARSMWQYAAGASDGASSGGVVASSNVAEGFLMFLGAHGERWQVKNDAHGCIPFGATRLLSNRDAVFRAVEEHKRARKRGTRAHPDAAWIESRFSWKSKDFGGVDLEPPALWGSHDSEDFVASWARELGIARADCVRLEPEVVCIAATEPSKLRVSAKALAE